MRLLDKKSIEVQKSTERKREIEEGKKLANSVDSLRQTLGKEQENLRNFRDATMNSIKAEIDVLSKKKEALNLEIEALEARRKESLMPIDLSKEWKEVEIQKKDLLQRETYVISREILVQELDKREIRIAEKEKKIDDYFENSRSSYEKAENIRNEIEKNKKDWELVHKTRLNELEVKEKDVISREAIASQQIEQTKKDKNEILLKGTELIERESTLDSKEKELNKKEFEVGESEKLAQRYKTETIENYEKSSLTLHKAEIVKAQNEKEIKERNIVLSEREREIGYRERDIMLERDQIESDKKGA